MKFMSHIIFGDFCKENINKNTINEIKIKLRMKGLIIDFDKELNRYYDVNKMLVENAVKKRNGVFCITSMVNKLDSEDLLFPYENYSQKELFPNGDDRTVFEKICKKNLELFHSGIKELVRLLTPKTLRIFIVSGYDNNFQIVNCTIEDMIKDIETQVLDYFELDSKMYNLLVK